MKASGLLTPTCIMTTRRKTTSKMPADVPITDVSEVSSAASHDQDFDSFVRSTLSALNTKMDSLLISQAAFETKLESIERRVTINTTVTTELSRATEFNSNQIKDQQIVIDTLKEIARRTLPKQRGYVLFPDQPER